MTLVTNLNNALHILLVEDDIGDVELTRESLDECKILVDMFNVDNGIKALQYLRKEPPYENARMPDLIFLDLNMPAMDGREVLNEVKKDPDLKHIPVVILTTSSAEEDIVKTYTLGANCYLTKPVGMDEFIKLIQTVEEFWFTIVKLPPKK